jgi:hypothetical protein
MGLGGLPLGAGRLLELHERCSLEELGARLQARTASLLADGAAPMMIGVRAHSSAPVVHVRTQTCSKR